MRPDGLTALGTTASPRRDPCVFMREALLGRAVPAALAWSPPPGPSSGVHLKGETQARDPHVLPACPNKDNSVIGSQQGGAKIR